MHVCACVLACVRARVPLHKKFLLHFVNTSLITLVMHDGKKLIYNGNLHVFFVFDVMDC